MRIILLVVMFLAFVRPSAAQAPSDTRTPYHKMSVWVREIVRDGEHQPMRRAAQTSVGRNGASPMLTAFVRVKGDGGSVLNPYQARVLTQMDDICIAQIPLSSLSALSRDSRVQRIEANRLHHITMDTTALVLNALPVYEGYQLPQAYTGEGVVVGVQDIGFDLTHPTLYDTTGTRYRVKCVWDMLSADTIGSAMPVGADYTDPDAIVALGCVRDGIISSHGTHTSGTAAGSGYGTSYRGMAYESDICLVANAVSSDLQFISPDDIYKYTYATDALGFKYLFDYADAVGKPCVVSFSEGSHQDFRGDDVLYYEMLDKLVGPGHILVASAGNEGLVDNYMHKPAGVVSAATDIRTLNSDFFTFSIRGSGEYALKLTAHHYGQPEETATIFTRDILAMPDSMLTDTLRFADIPYFVKIAAYPSCYDEHDCVLEGQFSTVKKKAVSEGAVDSVDVNLGAYEPVTLELDGESSDIQLFVSSGYIHPGWGTSPVERSHNIHSPGSAPSVICVGANTHRRGFINQFGDYITQETGYQGAGNGKRALYSSTGPTFDGRIKPEVLAPGTNVMASYSSWTDSPPVTLTQFTEFKGRTYPWGANSGTSMATPVVSGAIALWLQANPRLTPDDVRGVLARTCRKVGAAEGADYPNNEAGYGEIDVYRGLLDVLDLKAAIHDLSDTQPESVRFAIHGNRLELAFASPLSQSVSWRVYSVGGAQMLQGQLPSGSDCAVIDLAALPPAVYAVQLNSLVPGITGSTLVRISGK